MSHPKKYQLFVDGDKYEWERGSISAAELRILAGIPDGAEIYMKVPGSPDTAISNDTVVDLEKHHGPAKFSTQSPGSQAGSADVVA